MTVTTIQPVRKDITVAASPGRVFEVFTAGMGRWWIPENRIGREPFQTVVVEPHEGGRWFERDGGGEECDWGRVLVWDPPARLVLAWQLNAEWKYDPDLVTEVEVRFVDAGDGRTRVELEHRGLEAYGEAREGVRSALDSPGGWSGLLDRFGGEAGAGA